MEAIKFTLLFMVGQTVVKILIKNYSLPNHDGNYSMCDVHCKKENCVVFQ